MEEHLLPPECIEEQKQSTTCERCLRSPKVCICFAFPPEPVHIKTNIVILQV